MIADYSPKIKIAIVHFVLECQCVEWRLIVKLWPSLGKNCVFLQHKLQAYWMEAH